MKTIYRANNGKEFEYKEDCINYESMGKIKSIPKTINPKDILMYDERHNEICVEDIQKRIRNVYFVKCNTKEAMALFYEISDQQSLSNPYSESCTYDTVDICKDYKEQLNKWYCYYDIEWGTLRDCLNVRLREFDGCCDDIANEIKAIINSSF